MAYSKGLVRTLQVLGVAGWLGLSAYGSIKLEEYDTKYVRPNLPSHLTPHPMNNLEAGSLGAFLGGAAGIIVYQLVRKKKPEKLPDYCSGSGDDDSHPDENVSDYRGPMGYR